MLGAAKYGSSNFRFFSGSGVSNNAQVVVSMAKHHNLSNKKRSAKIICLFNFFSRSERSAASNYIIFFNIGIKNYIS